MFQLLLLFNLNVGEMYHTVECINFSGEYEICIIHSSWICGDRMYWPPNTQLYYKYIHKKHLSEIEKEEIENWPSFKFKIIKSYGKCPPSFIN